MNIKNSKSQKLGPNMPEKLKLWTAYVLFACMSIGGIKIVQNLNNSKSTSTELIKEPIQNNEPHIESMVEPQGIGEGITGLYDVADSNFKINFINDNWNAIVAGLLEFETYFEKPHLNRGESRYTYGPGLTWVYIDGKQYPCTGKYKTMADGFSSEQIWDQVKQHCLRNDEALDRIQTALIKNDFSEISQKQLLGLFFAAYQSPGAIGGIIKRLKEAGDDEQKIVDSFIAGREINRKWRTGTNKRRWWCAMIYIGKITVDDILFMDMDAFTAIKIDKIHKSGHFITDNSTVNYALDRNNFNTETVQDFMESESQNIAYQKIKTSNFNRGIQKIKELNKRHKEDMFVYTDNEHVMA